MTREIDLKPEHLALVQAVLHAHLKDFPDARVWVFGSRANGRSHQRSDIDLAIDAGRGQPLPRPIFYALKQAFEDSDLPQMVDVVDTARITDDIFRKNLEKDALPLPLLSAA
ncbi:hypothetical protein AXK11_08135 [Cephaloticoccus primus]|uniref:Polymerase beta nucleotidyltransferase domain-containing protein n=1 Tax=Cephaloticoccus primus TaxID=1548207 RepID=A0A139SJC0_9BACT|nr:nucleotidyltransferase domain-containing protein [Cephaloticoccus primus]KXU34621.1 hypothetical protein AXK11_08135 [Cephaloticoccus primus]